MSRVLGLGGPDDPGGWKAGSRGLPRRVYQTWYAAGQNYEQLKDQLGWTDFQVRSDIAIRRHQALVNCALCFCWDVWFADHPPQDPVSAARTRPRRRGTPARPCRRRARPGRLAFPVDRAAALVAGMVHGAPPPQLQALMNSAAAHTSISQSTNYCQQALGCRSPLAW